MCVVHCWLNALDLNDNGSEVKVIVEGSATKLLHDYHNDEKAMFRPLYLKVKERDLIDAVCEACATKMGSLDSAKAEGLPIVGDMSGHPAMSKYLNDGYSIITF